MRFHLVAAANAARLAEDAIRDGNPPDYYLARMNGHLKWVRDHMAGGNDYMGEMVTA